MINSAWPKDIPQVVALYKNHIAQGLAVQYTETDLVTLAWANRLLVASDSEVIVGFLLSFDCVTWGYVDVLFVSPEFRGRGHGKALMKRVCEVHPWWGTVEISMPVLSLKDNDWLFRQGFERVSNKLHLWKYKIVKNETLYPR